MSEIRNRSLVGQVVDFAGLQWGRCKCTDIDLSLDWQGRTFAFVELKYGGTGLTLGQRIHLEALVDGLTAGGKTAYAIHASHNSGAEGDVQAATAQVVQVYTPEGWSSEPQGQSLQRFLNELYSVHQQERA
jgi:hypothetical protein